MQEGLQEGKGSDPGEVRDISDGREGHPGEVRDINDGRGHPGEVTVINGGREGHPGEVRDINETTTPQVRESQRPGHRRLARMSNISQPATFLRCPAQHCCQTHHTAFTVLPDTAVHPSLNSRPDTNMFLPSTFEL